MQSKTQLCHRLATARQWLHQAEESFGKKQEVQGELNLFLAQAELQHVREGRKLPFWLQPRWGWQRMAMAFAVLLTVPEAEAPVIATALQAPVWDLYLGRKSCVPTDFIYRGLFADEQQARQAALELATAKERLALFQVLEGEHEGEVLTLNDVPLQFGEHKKYRDRRVTVVAM